MTALTAKKINFFNALRITKRDVRVFALSAVLFSSIAFGAAALAQPAHTQMAGNGICSSDKFFR